MTFRQFPLPFHGIPQPHTRLTIRVPVDRIAPGRVKVPEIDSRQPGDTGRRAPCPAQAGISLMSSCRDGELRQPPRPRRVHLARGAAAPRRQCPTPGHRTRHPALQSARTAAEAPRPRQALESRGGRELAITWRPGLRPHWLRPSQWRRSPAAVGPEAAAPARARVHATLCLNSPRYRVMCCCSCRRRCRRPWCPGSSAALLEVAGRGRGPWEQGCRAPRASAAPASGSSSSRTPQVMPPPPASA